MLRTEIPMTFWAEILDDSLEPYHGVTGKHQV